MCPQVLSSSPNAVESVDFVVPSEVPVQNTQQELKSVVYSIVTDINATSDVFAPSTSDVFNQSSEHFSEQTLQQLLEQNMMLHERDAHGEVLLDQEGAPMQREIYFKSSNQTLRVPSTIEELIEGLNSVDGQRITTLTQEYLDAISQAHEAGLEPKYLLWNEKSQTYEYSEKALDEKMDILRGAGFSIAQSAYFLRMGVCGMWKWLKQLVVQKKAKSTLLSILKDSRINETVSGIQQAVDWYNAQFPAGQLDRAGDKLAAIRNPSFSAQKDMIHSEDIMGYNLLFDAQGFLYIEPIIPVIHVYHAEITVESIPSRLQEILVNRVRHSSNNQEVETWTSWYNARFPDGQKERAYTSLLSQKDEHTTGEEYELLFDEGGMLHYCPFLFESATMSVSDKVTKQKLQALYEQVDIEGMKALATKYNALYPEGQPERAYDNFAFFEHRPLPKYYEAIPIDETISGSRVVFNSQGFLEVLPTVYPIKYVRAPINENMPNETLNAIRELHAEYLQTNRYSTLADLNSFIRFVREARLINPGANLKDLHVLYAKEMSIQDTSKEHAGSGEVGGNCFHHSDAFLDVLKADSRTKDVQAYLLLNQGYNVLTKYPVERTAQSGKKTFKPRNWDNALDFMQHSHGCIAVQFTRNNERFLLYLPMGEGASKPSEMFIFRDGKFRPIVGKGNINMKEGYELEWQKGASFPDIAIEGDMSAAAICCHRSLPALSNVNVNQEDNTNGFRIDFINGLARLVTTDLSTLAEFTVERDRDSGTEPLSFEYVRRGEDSEEILSVDHTTHLAGSSEDRHGIGERSSGEFELKTDIRYMFDHPNEVVNVTRKHDGEEILTQKFTCIQALALYLRIVQRQYSLPVDFPQNMMFIFKRLDEYKDFLYPFGDKED